MKIIAFLITYIKKHKRQVSLFMLLNLVLWAISILTPFIVGEYIDRVVESDDRRVILVAVISLAVVWALQIALSYFRNMISVKVNTLVGYSVNFELIEYIKRLPVQYFAGKDPAYINSRVSLDSGSVTGFVLGSVLGLVTTILTFSLSLTIMFFLNIEIALMICLIFPVYILIYYKFKDPLYDAGLKVAEESNTFFSTQNKQISNIKPIKQHDLNIETAEELNVGFSTLYKATIKNARLGYIFNNIDAIVRYMANMIIFIYSGVQIIEGYMTIGQFTMINSYSLMLISSLSVFLGFGKSYRNSLVSFNRIQELYSTAQEENGSVEIDSVDCISISNLSFCYGDKSILKNLNFKMNKGNIYAIVGENGSGKSTLIDIIVGLRHEYSGEIKYNSTDLREIETYSLRKRHIAIVEQEPTLYYNKVMEHVNTTGIDNTAADYWINRLDLSYLVSSYDSCKNQTWQTNLSGGEKQRLTIARALIKNTDVLVMDEPNSAIDNDSLQLLIDIILELKNEKLIILVTHNKDLISISDFVIRL